LRLAGRASETGRYIRQEMGGCSLMSKKKIGKLDRNARNRGVPEGALRKPIIRDIGKWFAELDAIVGGETFMENGREQPRTPS
jgi:hypothetical protein